MSRRLWQSAAAFGCCLHSAPWRLTAGQAELESLSRLRYGEQPARVAAEVRSGGQRLRGEGAAATSTAGLSDLDVGISVAEACSGLRAEQRRGGRDGGSEEARGRADHDHGRVGGRVLGGGGDERGC